MNSFLLMLILFLCTFMSLVITSEAPMNPGEAFIYSKDNKLGGGFFGGAVSYVLLSGFGKAGKRIWNNRGIYYRYYCADYFPDPSDRSFCHERNAKRRQEGL